MSPRSPPSDEPASSPSSSSPSSSSPPSSSVPEPASYTSLGSALLIAAQLGRPPLPPPPPVPFLQRLEGCAYLLQQISLVSLLLLLFELLEAEARAMEPATLRALFLLPALPLLCLLPAPLAELLPSLLNAAYLLLCLRGLSPVLSTLTASYASDTIYSLSVASLVLHLAAHDYAARDGGGGPLSQKAGLVATVLLTSRVALAGAGNAACFLFLILAAELFCFSPAVRKRAPPGPSLAAAVFLGGAALGIAAARGSGLLLPCAGMLLTVGGVAPAWEAAMAGRKQVVAGRWDILHLEVKDRY
ncbi:hypothetical protein TeGR_g13841 [Tetraparma gracilis]|uniref:Phosphatidylinositol N-acetylglucosaminyltransferase n=1 Tax=Tetraparma gracilis TaxID=2962635 RepID=A0ABQ6N7F2_9STRA|nr:hypothetical protein TeGR_g13841 [Tetraparma gracilis]